MLGIFYGILAAIGQGLGYALLKKSFEERPAALAYFSNMVFGLLIWIPLSLYIGVEWGKLPIVLFYAGLSALLAEAFTYYVLSKADLSLTQPVFSTYPLFTLLFSRFVNGDTLTMPAIIAIVVTIFGVVVLAFPQNFDKAELRKRLLLLWPLAGALAVGISDSLSKHVIDAVSMSTFLFSLALMQIPVALGYLWLEKENPADVIEFYRSAEKNKFALLGSFTIVTTLIFFWLAFEHTLASIASPITATYVVFALIFAAIIVKEKVAKKDLLGIILTICGVLILSFLVL